MAQTQEQTQEQTEQVQAKEAQLEELDENQQAVEEPSLDVLLDINMPIDVVIGKTEIKFRELVQLGPGAVLPLDKPIGQPADLYVQEIKFATGDIVVVDGCFAVRIKEIMGMEPDDISADMIKQSIDEQIENNE